MVEKKSIGEKTSQEFWDEKLELVKPISIKKYVSEVADTEKLIVFGESNAGKTSFYLSILGYLEKQGVKKEDLLMCVIYPDRPTGLTKLYGNIPKEYRENILVFPTNSYEELVNSTAVAEKYLKEHFKKTGKHGWLVVELLEDAWKSSQDYYCRLAYGETMGEYFAKKRADVKAMKEDNTAYKSLDGWGDWPIIKYFHNYNWIDRIKRMPWNVVFTAEIKAEGNKDSIFFSLGYRPSGEKDNLHRVDSILYLSHKENKFQMRAYKLTGFRKLYSLIDITDKNPYVVHKDSLERLEKLGYKTSKIEEVEKEAGITPPPKPEKKEPETPKPKEEKPEESMKELLEKKDKTIKAVSGGKGKEEKVEKMTKDELTESLKEKPVVEDAVKEKPKPKKAEKKEPETEWEI